MSGCLVFDVADLVWGCRVPTVVDTEICSRLQQSSLARETFKPSVKQELETKCLPRLYKVHTRRW